MPGIRDLNSLNGDCPCILYGIGCDGVFCPAKLVHFPHLDRQAKNLEINAGLQPICPSRLNWLGEMPNSLW